MSHRFAAVIALLVLPTVVCAQAPRVERVKHGDTTIVRTTGPGLWGAPRNAIEVKRIGGETNETTLSAVYSTTALANGGVLLFDEKGWDGPALRMFDSDGKFVRTVGRVGSGPGEYPSSGGLIAALPDGSFVLRQYNGTVSRFRADGTFLNTFRFQQGSGGARDVYPGPAGTIFVRAGFGANTNPAERGMTDMPMIRYDTTGRVLDSLLVPTYLTARPLSQFDPNEWWLPLPDGRSLASRTDRVGFLIRSRAGGRTLFLADVLAEGPVFLPEERKEWQAVMVFLHDRMGQATHDERPAATVPDRKLVSGGARLDLQGRVWVARTGRGVKGAPRIMASYGDGGRDGKGGSISVSYEDLPVYAAFRLDGTYLGELRFPAHTKGISFSGDHAWGIVTGDDDAPRLVKFHIPGTQADH